MPEAEFDPAGGTGPPEPEPFRILFVCTGNTCRSPLAAALARRAIDARGWTGVEVRSAGISAFPGDEASEGAMRVAAGHGLDLSSHRSARVDPDVTEWSDLILAMSPRHLPAVAAAGGAERATTITSFARGTEMHEDEGGVPDPFGGGDAVYEEAYRALEELVERTLDRLAPVVAP